MIETLLYRLELAGVKPLVHDPDAFPGGVTVEAWNGVRKINVYRNADGTHDYLKSWGPDMDTEMEAGPLASPDDVTKLVVWLLYL